VHLAEMMDLIDSGTLSTRLAKRVLEEVFNTGKAPRQIVKERGYTQITDASAVDAAVEEAIKANSKAVSDYLGGKETAARFLVGQVMKLTRGQAKPDIANDLVRRKLEALKTAGHTGN